MARRARAIKQKRGKLLIVFSRKAVLTLRLVGAEIVQMAKKAAQSEFQTIVAGGGDGTLAAVASELVGTDKTFGVLPLGTFNYFARNLGIPLDAEEAARNIVEGHTAQIDVGEVNGKTFLINASLGLHPAMLREREKLYSRWGRSRIAAFFSGALTMLRPASFLRLRLTTANGERMLRKTPLVFVGFNKYQLEEINIRGGACLAAGEMAFYIANPMGRIELLRLAVRGLFGRLRDSEDFQVLCLKEARVEARSKRLRVSLDGELFTMKTPLDFRVLPKVLRVIVPEKLKDDKIDESEER